MAELERTLSSRELAEWMAYYDLDPFGAERGDFHAALVAQTVANVNRRPGTAPYRLKDFLPEFGRPDPDAPRQTVEQQIEVMKRLTRVLKPGPPGGKPRP